MRFVDHRKTFQLFFLLSSCLLAQEIDQDLKDIISDNPELLTEFNVDSKIQQNDLQGEDTSIDTDEGDSIQFESENKIFGNDYIKSIPKSISATADLPVPNDYIVSLGDKLKIILTGGKKDIFVLQVGMNGNILFPELGAINIFGKSIRDVRKTIKQLVELSYVGTEVSVSLDTLAARKINIIGAVKNPGTFIVSPFSTVSSSLSYSGGFEDYASLRNIVIIRQGEEINFDLYDFLIFGSREGDINIQQGDTILVNSTNNLIKISGAVNRPMVYEYNLNDKYSDLINFALGLSRDGDNKNITVTINENGRALTERKNIDELIRDETIESLYVGNKVSIKQLDVFVSGNAVTSGFYPTQGEKLSEFLGKLNFSSDIYPFYAVYESTEARGLINTIQSFSLADPDSYSNLEVSKNTKLKFFSRDDISRINETNFNFSDELEINEFDLAVINLPERSLRVPLNGKFSPKQLYEFFGSPLDIDSKKVSVVSQKSTVSDAYTKIFDSKDLVAISFPSINSASLINVQIAGEVFNPGIYSISSSSTLNDLYTLAGGFRNQAFNEGIEFYREDIKEKQIQAIKEAKSILTDSLIQRSSTVSDRGMIDIEAILRLADLTEPKGRISGNFSENSIDSSNFILKDQDYIFIPSISVEVTVQGEVLNSSSFIFDRSMSYSDYIKASGGYTFYADKNSAFIIRANGESIPAGTNIFSGQADIYPGDTIVIPRDLDQLEALPVVSMATKIISDIAFSAASLNAIQN